VVATQHARRLLRTLHSSCTVAAAASMQRGLQSAGVMAADNHFTWIKTLTNGKITTSPM
jgi:hypothetical protein